MVQPHCTPFMIRKRHELRELTQLATQPEQLLSAHDGFEEDVIGELISETRKLMSSYTAIMCGDCAERCQCLSGGSATSAQPCMRDCCLEA